MGAKAGENWGANWGENWGLRCAQAKMGRYCCRSRCLCCAVHYSTVPNVRIAEQIDRRLLARNRRVEWLLREKEIKIASVQLEREGIGVGRFQNIVLKTKRKKRKRKRKSER
jgi:hypothetical protein